MPVKRRLPKRRQDINENEEHWLRCEPSGFVQFKPADQLAELWRDHRDRIIAEHVSDFPGTRPQRWWEYDAPEPRRRLGGTGTPGLAIDPNDPPIFESEAAYLERHGLFLPGERKRLRKVDFEPEAAT